jgi:hypothetical protein
MKKIFFLISVTVALCSFGQTGTQSITGIKANRSDVPNEVLTDDSTSWTISTLSTIGYVNTSPGPYYNNYKSGGGMIVKLRFKKGNRFEFMLYVQVNTYGTDTETWTQFEGDVVFGKDEKGQPVFTTKAEKGVYRVTKNGTTTSRAIPEADLKTQHSNTYLWEKTSFPDDPKNSYLLVVDLDAHPQADINKAGSIDPSWVSKFHIPVKK